jgi:hypothetical protein
MNKYADLLKSACPAAIADLEKGTGMAWQLVERNLTVSLPSLQEKSTFGPPVVDIIRLFGPIPSLADGMCEPWPHSRRMRLFACSVAQSCRHAS